VKSAVRATVGLGADVTSLRTELTDLASAVATPAPPDEAIPAALSLLDTSMAERAEQQTVELARRLDAALTDLRRDVRSDVQSAKADIESLGRAIDELELEVSQPAPEPDYEAGAALVASVASAMTHLETRIDGDFDALGRHMEAVGTLLAQVIDAIHRVESHVVGVQPSSERTRTAANTVLESMRANVRQRANRRTGPPQELGTGQ
jgi:hypothetical protein